MAKGSVVAGREDRECRIVSKVADLPSIFGPLFDRGARTSLDQSLPWYENLIETVFTGDEVRLVTVSRGQDPVAVLPLRLIRQHGRNEMTSLGNYYTWSYGPALSAQASADDLRLMLERIATAFSPLSAIRLASMDPLAPAFPMLIAAMRKSGWVPFPYFCYGNWYLDVGPGGWDGYLDSRGSEMLNTLRRKGKKFTAGGGTLDVITGGDNLEPALRAFQAVYSKSWKQVEPFESFIPGLVRMLARNGWLRLGVASIGDVPVAAQIWMVCHGKASIYKLAYDESYSGFSPGTVLTAHLMRHVIETDGVREVDYLIGDDPYKKAWMSGRRERWGIVAYNPRVIAGVTGLAREVSGRAVKRVLMATGARSREAQ